ncbi:unnamed protein product [Boreogadus saida]
MDATRKAVVAVALAEDQALQNKGNLGSARPTVPDLNLPPTSLCATASPRQPRRIMRSGRGTPTLPSLHHHQTQP